MSGRRAKRERRKQRGDDQKPKGARSGARREDGRRRASARKGRPVLFAVLVAATLGLAGFLLKPAIFGRDVPPPDSTIIDVRANMRGFDRSVIRVPAGKPVTIRLTSLDNRYHVDGGGKHQFAVDELGVNIIAPSLGSAQQTFTPTEPGVYVFYCDICCGGRANPTMSGKLVVTQA